MLSALDLARRIEAGELTPRAVVDLCAEAIAAREPEIGAFAALDIDGARGAPPRRPGSRSCRSRGLPVGIKDIFDTADLPTAYGSPIYAGHRPTGRRRAWSCWCGAPAASIARQDRHHRIRIARAAPDPQPAQSRAHAGRLVLRLGRGGRRRHAADRARQPDRRLGHPPGGLLRRRRLQAVVQAAADGRHEMLLLVARHRRTVRRRRRRRGVRGRRHQRPRPAGRRHGRRASPRIAIVRTASVGRGERADAVRGRAGGARRRSGRRARSAS